MLTASTPRRVLLVDDHDDSRDLFREVLELAGHIVTAACCGEEALGLLLDRPFDAAVLDIGLPDLDGDEVATRARAALAERTPRLIALSGYGRESHPRVVRAHEFDVYLQKPIDAEALLSAIL